MRNVRKLEDIPEENLTAKQRWELAHKRKRSAQKKRWERANREKRLFQRTDWWHRKRTHKLELQREYYRKRHQGLYVENLTSERVKLFGIDLKKKSFWVPPFRQKKIKLDILLNILGLVKSLDKMDRLVELKKKTWQREEARKNARRAYDLLWILNNDVKIHFDGAYQKEATEVRKIYRAQQRHRIYGKGNWNDVNLDLLLKDPTKFAPTYGQKSTPSKRFNDGIIICRDSIEVLKRIPEGCIDLCFVSPPYYRFKRKYDMMSDDYKSPEEYYSKLDPFWIECKEVLKPGGYLIVNIQPTWTESEPTHHVFTTRLRELGFVWENEVVWDKREWSMQDGGKLYSTYEFVEIYRNGGRRMGFPSDLADEERKAWGKSIWFIPPDGQGAKYEHDATFPEELAWRVIKLYSNPGNCVMDFFNGTGTTCVAARLAGRRFFGIEFAKKHCQQAIKRLNGKI